MKVDEQSFIAAAESGLSINDLSATFNLSFYDAWERLKRYEIDYGLRLKNSRRSERMKKIQDEKAMELYNQGLSDREVGEHFGVSARAVQQWRNDRDLPSKWQRPKKSEIPPPNKLIDDDEAYALYQKGYYDHEIAEHFGAKTASVSSWRNKKGLPANKKEEPAEEKEEPDEEEPVKTEANYLPLDEWIAERCKWIAAEIIKEVTNVKEIPKELRHEHELLIFMIDKMREVLR